MTDTPMPQDQWARVEIFGHRQHVGRISEVERFSTKMLRIDEPTNDPEVFTTLFYGGSSIFSIAPVTEQAAREWVARYRRVPPPRPALTVAGGDLDDGRPF
jgi:hypothetical protein